MNCRLRILLAATLMMEAGLLAEASALARSPVSPSAQEPERRKGYREIGGRILIPGLPAQSGQGRSEIFLPEPAAPIAAYVPAVLTGNLLHVSGQIPVDDKGAVMSGRLGENRDVGYGYAAARACAVMLLAQINKALGGLDRVDRIVKLTVFVTSAPTFTDQSKVANGASDLMEQVFGESGRHARSSVGVAALPRGAAVEIEAMVAVRRN